MYKLILAVMCAATVMSGCASIEEKCQGNQQCIAKEEADQQRKEQSE